jgi:Tannase and feruloyl esterase
MHIRSNAGFTRAISGWITSVAIAISAYPGISSATDAACSLPAIQAIVPAGMTVGAVPVLLPPEPKLTSASGVKRIAANAFGDGAPEFCYVTGSIVTDQKTHRIAHFAAALPSRQAWNGKFMFQGCGGNCGVLFAPSPQALRKGYPVWVTDDGHVAKPGPDPRLWQQADATWAVSSPGHRDEGAVTDFSHRAVHTVTEVGKEFTKRYYAALKLSYSYFDGCSDGGREGMVELTHYPGDFDGIIAGAPYFDIKNQIAATLIGVLAQLRSPEAAVPLRLFEVASRLITDKCDAEDGVKDGLIQNPQSCTFDPQRDLPKCAAGATGEKCFTADQIDTLGIILAASRDPAGEVVYSGWSPSDMGFRKEAGAAGDQLMDWLGFPEMPDNLHGPQPWSRNPTSQPLGWYWSNQTAEYLVYDGSSDFNAMKSLGITFVRDSHGIHAVVPDETIELLRKRTVEGSGVTAADAAEYLRQGRKLIMYHGFSDGDISPYRTVQYYNSLAKLSGGIQALQKNARLFMVPGVAHCFGGPGPNHFGQVFSSPGDSEPQPNHDILASLESWVEKGEAPAQIIATKYEHDDPGARVMRTMPLCVYPAMARFKGRGDLNDASNWTCSGDDRRLLKQGPVGIVAGVFAPLK